MNSFDKERCVSYLIKDDPYFFNSNDDNDVIIDSTDKYVKANKLFFIIPFPDWNYKEFMDPFIKEIYQNNLISKELSICDKKELKNYKNSLKISICRIFDVSLDILLVEVYILEVYKKSIETGFLSEKVFVLDLELKKLSKLIEYFGTYYVIYNMFGKSMMKNTQNQKITLFQILFDYVYKLHLNEIND